MGSCATGIPILIGLSDTANRLGFWQRIVTASIGDNLDG